MGKNDKKIVKTQRKLFKKISKVCGLDWNDFITKGPLLESRITKSNPFMNMDVLLSLRPIVKELSISYRAKGYLLKFAAKALDSENVSDAERQGAIKILRKSLQMNPRDKHVLIHLGDLQEEHEKAKAFFHKSLDIDPEFPLAQDKLKELSKKKK